MYKNHNYLFHNVGVIALHNINTTGQPRYVKLANLEYMAYIEVIIHSQAFPLYCFVFQTCLCRTWLSRNIGYIEVVFHSRNLIFIIIN